MKKKIKLLAGALIFSAILFSLIFSAGNVFAAIDTNFPILDRQVEIRQARLEWLSEIQEISMGAMIGYIGEINGDTASLSLLLSDSEKQTAKIKTLTTHIALNNAIRQLKQITVDFKKETKKQMKENNGKTVLLLKGVKAALDENEAELEKLKDAYWELRKENVLKVFDIRINHAKDILDKLEKHGYDITEAQKKLAEIENKRSGLEDALEKRDNTAINQARNEIFKLSKELAQIVKDLQVKILQKVKVGYWVNLGDRVVERTEIIISELKTLGIDVAELEEIYKRAEIDLKEARDKFTAGDFEGAIESLKKLKADFIELREAYKELVSGGELAEDTETILESAVSSMDGVVGDMDSNL